MNKRTRAIPYAARAKLPGAGIDKHPLEVRTLRMPARLVVYVLFHNLPALLSAITLRP